MLRSGVLLLAILGSASFSSGQTPFESAPNIDI